MVWMLRNNKKPGQEVRVIYVAAYIFSSMKKAWMISMHLQFGLYVNSYMNTFLLIRVALIEEIIIN